MRALASTVRVGVRCGAGVRFYAKQKSTLESHEDETFSYKLAATPPTEFADQDIARAVDLYKCLFQGSNVGPSKAYRPMYYLERALLSYTRWIVPTSRQTSDYMFAMSRNALIVPLFATLAHFERSAFTKHNAIPYETSIAPFIKKRDELAQADDAVVLALAFNPGAQLGRERVFPLSSFTLLDGLALERLLLKMFEAKRSPMSLDRSVLEGIKRHTFLVQYFKKDGRPMLMTRATAKGRALLVSTAFDVALLSVSFEAVMYNVAAEDVTVAPITLANLSKLISKEAKIQGLCIQYGFVADTMGLKTMEFPSLNGFLKVFKMHGIPVTEEES